jgi:hypothetical protein
VALDNPIEGDIDSASRVPPAYPWAPSLDHEETNMADPQRQWNTAKDWFLVTIPLAIVMPAVVFLVLRWAGQADFAVEGAIVSAGVVIGTAILRTFRNRE